MFFSQVYLLFNRYDLYKHHNYQTADKFTHFFLHHDVRVTIVQIFKITRLFILVELLPLFTQPLDIAMKGDKRHVTRQFCISTYCRSVTSGYADWVQVSL